MNWTDQAFVCWFMCACLSLCLRTHTHTLIMHVMWNATCISDGYQHVRWYLRKPAVKRFRVKQLEQGREDNNNVIIELTPAEIFIFFSLLIAVMFKRPTACIITSHSCLVCLIYPNPWKQIQKRKLIPRRWGVWVCVQRFVMHSSV